MGRRRGRGPPEVRAAFKPTEVRSRSSPYFASGGDRSTKSTFAVVVEFGGSRPQASLEAALSGFDARALLVEPLPARLVDCTEPGQRHEASIREFVNMRLK